MFPILYLSTSSWLESGRNELGIQRLSNRYQIYAGDNPHLLGPSTLPPSPPPHHCSHANRLPQPHTQPMIGKDDIFAAMARKFWWYKLAHVCQSQLPTCWHIHLPFLSSLITLTTFATSPVAV